MNPSIKALQFAEQELKDHDKREAELKDELRELKRTRAVLAARVQECIDVLCGRKTPDLFDGVDGKPGEHQCDASAADAGPVVCAPVGSAKLKDIPGLTAQDIACLSAVGLNTLADLERECDGDLDRITETLGHWAGAFTDGEASRIALAVTRHLRPATVPAEPKGVTYPPKDDWRAQGLALLGLNEKLLKACRKEEVLTLGELHDWIDEDSRQVGGFFGEGGAVLVNALARIGKIATKWAKANADIVFQFLADKGFGGVPTKEEVAAL